MRVILESPFAGQVGRNIGYARSAMLDSLNRDESPFASHLLYTQVLDDKDPSERKLGMTAAQAWYSTAEMVVVYQDYGISGGMQAGIDLAKSLDIPVEYRNILPRDVCP